MHIYIYIHAHNVKELFLKRWKLIQRFIDCKEYGSFFLRRIILSALFTAKIHVYIPTPGVTFTRKCSSASANVSASQERRRAVWIWISRRWVSGSAFGRTLDGTFVETSRYSQFHRSLATSGDYTEHVQRCQTKRRDNGSTIVQA